MSDEQQFTIKDDVDVELIKNTATDDDVIWAARVSTVGELASVHPPEARRKGLINYLMKHRHGSPFEHTSMTFRISAPIFVFREFQRHRVGWSYNEASGRYMGMAPMFYVPPPGRNLVQEGKAGAYTFVQGTEEQFTATRNLLARNARESYAVYQSLLEMGVAKEVARMSLPLNLFSHMYATCNARSLMHFLGLRTHSEDAAFPSFPQREIEMVAEKMETEFARLMPLTYEAFCLNGRVSP